MCSLRHKAVHPSPKHSGPRQGYCEDKETQLEVKETATKTKDKMLRSVWWIAKRARRRQAR